MKGSQLKLDFRFADEMDGMELVQFVNDAHSVESDPNNEMNFRKPTEKVTIEEVNKDILFLPLDHAVQNRFISLLGGRRFGEHASEVVGAGNPVPRRSNRGGCETQV